MMDYFMLAQSESVPIICIQQPSLQAFSYGKFLVLHFVTFNLPVVNHIWNVITYKCPKFDDNYTQPFNGTVITYPCQNLNAVLSKWATGITSQISRIVWITCKRLISWSALSGWAASISQQPKRLPSNDSTQNRFGAWQQDPDSKVHGVNMGPPGADRTHVGPCWARGLCYLGRSAVIYLEVNAMRIPCKIMQLTHCSLVMYDCISQLGHHWYR